MSRGDLSDRAERPLQTTRLLNAARWMPERASHRERDAWVNLRYNPADQYRQRLDLAIAFHDGRDLNSAHCGAPIAFWGVS